ncbi:MAG TPA: carbohydrate ABC transporter permease [Gaiellaceae bacterium]|jgi:multiple sugar transport system permease protein|nr:carbohydrate ABC transporter permease [Gaiellaceae bacterium]
MSAGAQPNFPTGGAGVASPRVAHGPIGRFLGRGAREQGGPRFSGVKNVFFVLLLAGISVLALYPFIWLLTASLKPQGDVFDNRLIPREWQWNYTGDPTPVPGDEKLFALPDTPVLSWMWNSVWIGLLAAVLVALSSAIVAFAFAYFRFPGRNALFALILATMMLPGAVTMIPVYLIWNEIGKATGELGRLAFLPDIGVNTQYPLWVPNLFGSAFYIFLLRQFFLGIPRDLFEAARIDGDGYFSMFRRIALPLAKPALIVVFIFELQAKWFDLMTPLIYLRDTALYTLPLGLKTILDAQGAGGGGEGRWEIIMAGTVVTVLPMVVLFAIFQRYFIEGIATQGRKG